MRLYRYVGPKSIAGRVRPEPAGTAIHSADDVRVWARKTEQELSDGCVIVTFVVDTSGVLLIADRRSEHVACAGGQPVCSAGELTFAIGRCIEVTEVTNQSTGYCPEPESWPAVAAALELAGLVAPGGFSRACEFRRCLCGNLTLVKNETLVCGMCGAALPAAYNVQEE
jgi:hypothetical protein